MRRVLSVAAGLLVLVLVRTSGANPLSNVDETTSGNFGTSSQRNAQLGALGPFDCAPTATVNSFQYLESRYGVTGLVDANPYNTINTLAGPGYMNVQAALSGALPSDIVNGKERAITEYNAGHPNQTLRVEGEVAPGTTFPPGQINAALAANLTVAGLLPNMQSTDPTMDFLHDQLAAGQDIELGILWFDPAKGVYAGGHVVTATGLFNADDTSNMGTLDFIDPWGSATTAFSNSGTITGLHNGLMQLSFTGGSAGAGGDPDNFDSVGTADIAFILAESPTPLPASVWGGLVLLAGLAIRCYVLRGKPRAANAVL